MRTWKAVQALVVVFAVVAFSSGTSQAAWPTTTATVCWSISGAPGVFVKSRIIPTGDGFYSTQSIYIEKGKIFTVEQGTAYVRGNYVYSTSSSAGRDFAMWTSQSYAIVNKNTLYGRSDSIGHDKNFVDGSLDTEYNKYTNTLTPVSCSTIWQ